MQETGPSRTPAPVQQPGRSGHESGFPPGVPRPWTRPSISCSAQQVPGSGSNCTLIHARVVRLGEGIVEAGPAELDRGMPPRIRLEERAWAGLPSPERRMTPTIPGSRTAALLAALLLAPLWIGPADIAEELRTITVYGAGQIDAPSDMAEISASAVSRAAQSASRRL